MNDLSSLFWSKVDKGEGTGCWLWTGYISPAGYGEFGRGHWRVHRLSWIMANGAFPFNLNVLHKCDNRACLRPDHLFLGTHADNVHDMVAKGRNRHGITCGEKCKRHKLTAKQVIAIKKSLKTGANVIALAKQHGVKRACIYSIKSGRTWKYLLTEEKQ